MNFKIVIIIVITLLVIIVFVKLKRTRSIGLSVRISSTNSFLSRSSTRLIRISRVLVRLPELSYSGGGEGERLGSWEIAATSAASPSSRMVSSLIRTRS